MPTVLARLRAEGGAANWVRFIRSWAIFCPRNYNNFLVAKAYMDVLTDMLPFLQEASKTTHVPNRLSMCQGPCFVCYMHDRGRTTAPQRHLELDLPHYRWWHQSAELKQLSQGPQLVSSCSRNANSRCPGLQPIISNYTQQSKWKKCTFPHGINLLSFSIF